MSKKNKPELSWTERGIESVKVTVRTDFTDAKEKGLVLRVTPNGTKTWALVYRRKSDGKKGRVTIGAFGNKSGHFSLSKARERAVELRGVIIAGRDPAHEKAEIRKAGTINELLDDYLADHPRPNAAWTKDCSRIFSKMFDQSSGM